MIVILNLTPINNNIQLRYKQLTKGYKNDK